MRKGDIYHVLDEWDKVYFFEIIKVEKQKVVRYRMMENRIIGKRSGVRNMPNYAGCDYISPCRPRIPNKEKRSRVSTVPIINSEGSLETVDTFRTIYGTAYKYKKPICIKSST